MDIRGYEFFQLDVGMDEGAPPRFDNVWDPSRTWAAEPFELFRCCLLRTLMSYNGLPTNEGGAELRPDLAAGYPEISADGLTWTFRLKDNLFYAPPMGTTPIQSTDIVRALERALRPDPFRRPDEEPRVYTPYANYFRDVIAGAPEFGDGKVSSISGLEARDAKTLVVHLTRPAGDLGARLAMPAAAPIPPGAADGHDSGYGRYLVASGPYMIEGSDQLDPSLPPEQQPQVAGYVPGTSLTLVENPLWRADSDDLRSALVQRIEIKQYDDQTEDDYHATVDAILGDEVDLALGAGVEPSDIERLRADSATASRVQVASANSMDFIQINLAVPPFDDVHVRRAINLVINKREIVSIRSPGDLIQRHAIPDAFENGLLSAYDPYATADDSGSVERAKAEMRLSRYDTDGDGLCDLPTCSGIYVPVRDDFPESGLAAEAFSEDLSQVGIGLNIQLVPPDDFFGFNFDPSNHSAMTFTYGWGSDYLSAASWFGPLASGPAIGDPSSGNLSLVGATREQLDSIGFGEVEVPSLDDQINACVARTGAAQFECWAEADQYLMERIVPWVPLSTRMTTRLISPSVQRFYIEAALTMPALDQIAVSRDT